VKVKIYVEGGGDNKDTQVRCRQGFAEYCKKLASAERRPQIIACGGREQLSIVSKRKFKELPQTSNVRS
jgi:hypothetical protein